MRTTRIALLCTFLAVIALDKAHGAGRYFEVEYAPSEKAGELSLGVTYTLWVPDGVACLRGVIVHQHGCGEGACKGGATASRDLHWQALAKKWDCALLGPSYHQEDQQNCRLWCDPRNGSRKTFLRALEKLAADTQHPELAAVPWCLWGHSGGAFWASLMQASDPERIVAIWYRSGTAFSAWEKGEIPAPSIPETAYGIPFVANPGAKEKDDSRFNGAWTGALSMFRAYRAKGAPAAFAPDPRTAHECGDSRYLAIPFFDACLAMRLPDPGSGTQELKPVDNTHAWLADLLGDTAVPATHFGGKADEAVWLPNASVAKAWVEYIKTGWVADQTPPESPTRVTATSRAGQGVELTWDANADFESGLRAFRIRRDGKDLARLPETPVGRFGKPLFQVMSYHDTPEAPVPEMRFLDATARPGESHTYEVMSVNGAELESPPGVAAIP